MKMMKLVLFTLSLVCIAPSYGINAKCDAPLPVYTQPSSGDTLVQAIAIGTYGDSSPSKALPYEHNEENVEWLCHLPVYDSVSPNGSNDNLCYFQQIFKEPLGDFAQRLWKGNCTTSQLTVKGANKLYKMGATLRKMYVDNLNFLSKEYNETKVFLISTPTQRTRQSLISFMLGMYPLDKRNGKTIEYTSYDDNVDIVKPNTKACPKLSQLYSINKKSSEWIQQMSSVENTLSKLNKIAGTTGKSSWDDKTSVDAWHDSLRARYCNNIPLPCKNSECVTEEDAQKIFDQADFESNNLMLGNETLKFAAGPLMSFIEDTFVKKMQSHSGYDFIYISGEPSSLLAIQSALSKPQGVPPYGSVIVFELWKSNDQKYYVRAFYNDKPIQITACHNPEMCVLSEFVMLVKNKYTIKDVSECGTL